jgi:hypothetical protein
MTLVHGCKFRTYPTGGSAPLFSWFHPGLGVGRRCDTPIHYSPGASPEAPALTGLCLHTH